MSPPSCIPGHPPAPPVERVTDAEEAEGLLSPIDETAVLPADLGQGGYDVVPEGQHAIASSTVARND